VGAEQPATIEHALGRRGASGESPHRRPVVGRLELGVARQGQESRSQCRTRRSERAVCVYRGAATGVPGRRVKVLRIRDRRGTGLRFHSASSRPISAGRRAWKLCAPMAVSERGVYRGFWRSSRCPVGAGCAGSLPRDAQATQTGLARGTGTVATAGSVRHTVRLLLGRWGVLRSPDGGSAPVYSGDHGGGYHGPERTGEVVGRLS
jgi:hypothetical protein